MSTSTKKVSRLRRAKKTRFKLRSLGETRLTIHRTPQHIYAQVISPEGNKILASASTVEKDLRSALANDELHLYYQPIIDLSSQMVCGVEALLRWHNPKYLQVSIEEIISIAEESDLIFEVGEWVLRAACQQYSVWQKQGLNSLHIAVNMSTRQFCEKVDSYLLINALLKEFHISGHTLQLEITESLMLEDLKQTREVLQRFKSLGIQLSVDDFGTGYSSLGYLRRFPVDTLKIDKSFIQDLNLNSGSDILIKAIIAMGQSLNLKVIAEGVETKEQLAFLLKHGCDMAQGYYFSKPVSAGELERLIETQESLFN